ncbi:CAP domain-containing protein [Macrococcus equi]|uniref:CAP domain-containing protein n=1 Tax=Macrococcus equi TaxID=3395462 RepID=UPI0039BE1105
MSIKVIIALTYFILLSHFLFNDPLILFNEKYSERQHSIYAKEYHKTPAKLKKYADGRFNTFNMDASLSYKRNIKLWTNDIVDNIIIRSNISFEEAAEVKDSLAYQNAMNPNLRNQVVLRRDNERPMIYPMKLNYATQTAFNIGQIINVYQLNVNMLKLVNKERLALHLKPLKYDKLVYQGAQLRANELAAYGHININGLPHVRPNNTHFSTAFNIPRANIRVGENTGMNFYRGNPFEVVSEKYMAEKFFNQWKASPLHYQNMLRNDYKYMAVSIKANHYNNIERGRYSYFFGVQGFSKAYKK